MTSTPLARPHDPPDADAAVRQRIRVLACAVLLIAVSVAGLSGRAPSPMQLFVYGMIVSPALALSAARSRTDAVLWALQIAAFWAFIAIRHALDDFGTPVVQHFPIAVDRLLGLGELPTIRLQSWFHTAGTVTALDRASAIMYGLHAVAPWCAGLGLLLAGGRHYRHFIIASVLLFFSALPVLALWPTMPPWMGAEGVVRVLREVSVSVDPASFDVGTRIDGNPVAAMPSLHMGLAWLVMLSFRSVGPRWFVAGLLYALMIVWSTVYGGEHYVADLLAGALLAWASWRATLWADARLG